MVEGRGPAQLVDLGQAFLQALRRVVENCSSLVVPVGPPSALAPLSETTMTSMLSNSPVSLRKASRRPM
jgi:hypothetical protein